MSWEDVKPSQFNICIGEHLEVPRVKKVVAFLLVASMALLGLAGCGSNEDSPKTDEGPAAVSTTNENPEPIESKQAPAESGEVSEEDSPFVGDWWSVAYRGDVDEYPGFYEYRLRLQPDGTARLLLTVTGEDMEWPSDFIGTGGYAPTERGFATERELVWESKDDTIDLVSMGASAESGDLEVLDELRFEYYENANGRFLMPERISSYLFEDMGALYPTAEEAEANIVISGPMDGIDFN